ncbi:MAG TPA: polysaccharide biosynthesis C-terminal domain-containing protein, partial [Sphingopyxis sp.]|nr:polysaccharide biosynthesis C-terminal domain-containing protein [Sphingopyxis sp.]
FMAVPFTLNFFASPSLSVLGASRSLISLSTTQLVLGVILTLAALPYGLFAVAISYVGRAYLTLPMQIWLLRRASGIRPIDSLRAVGPPLVASSLMGVALAIAMRLLDDRLAGWQSLLLLTAVGALFYGVALIAISGSWRGRFLSLSRQVRKNPI